jgi:hypothetical protein
MSDTSPPAPPAGWDPDPEESSNLERRWDGWQWTSDTRRLDIAAPARDATGTTPPHGVNRNWQCPPTEQDRLIAEGPRLSHARCPSPADATTPPVAVAKRRSDFHEQPTSTAGRNGHAVSRVAPLRRRPSRWRSRIADSPGVNRVDQRRSHGQRVVSVELSQGQCVPEADRNSSSASSEAHASLGIGKFLHGREK